MKAIPTYPHPGPRCVVVGVTGSGKTTLAKQLSSILNIPNIELDAVHWQPNWVMMETEAFRLQVAELIAADSWIADGNYSKARDILWARATTLIWLDYPFFVSFIQLINRSIRRLLRREELWNGNKETWRGMFLSKDSLLIWLLQSYPDIRKSYPNLLAQPEYAHLQVIRLRSREETQRFLQRLEMASSQ